MVVVLPFTVPNCHGHYQHRVGYNTDDWQAFMKKLINWGLVREKYD
jgi:hypothetical protein